MLWEVIEIRVLQQQRSWIKSTLDRFSIIFIPRREVRTHSPDGVHLKVFPIYIALVNEKGGFKNASVNRPISNHRKTLLSGWVGGDILGPLIFLKIVYNNKQDVLIPNMASQVVYGH